MWMNGYSLQAITEAFRGTSRQFEIRSLFNAKRDFNWGDRKAEIIKDIAIENSNTIKLMSSRLLQSIAMMTDMNYKSIENEYIKFREDPKAYLENSKMPKYLVKDMSEFLTLIKSKMAVIGELPPEGDTTINNTMILTAKEESDIWQILRNSATRKVMPT